MKRNFKSEMMLLTVTFIWGSSFVAQKFGLQNIGPLTFFGIRSLIGALFLSCLVLFQANTQQKSMEVYKRKDLLKGGILCGIALFTAGALQQVGVAYTTVGKTGFITSLYVVIVPLLGLFMGRRLKPLMILCIAGTVVGLYMLCMPAGEFSIRNFGTGEVLVLLSTFFFSVHIILIDKFTGRADSIKLSWLQFITVTVVALPAMFLIDPVIPVPGEGYCYGLPNLKDILSSIIPLLYSGVLSSGVAYTLQIKAQSHINPVVASVILCFEAVFAALCGAVVLHEMMSAREITGCIIMFISIAAAKCMKVEK